MNTKINLTKAVLDFASNTVGSKSVISDSTVVGLLVMISPKQTKSFYVRKKIHGRSERFFLGHYPDMTLEQARKKAQAYLGRLASGDSAEDVRRERKTVVTFGQAFAAFIEGYAKQHKKSWKQDVALFERYLPSWRTRQMKTITNTDAMKLHAKLGKENGQFAANRVLALISTVYNFSKRTILYKGDNPATGIRKFKEAPRQRYLTPDELPAFKKALEAETNETARDFIWLALLTGQRESNVMAMRWSEINFQKKEWRIPDTKNGTPMTVPLTEPAIEILNRRMEAADRCDIFVLPGSGKTGHITQPKKAWERLRAHSQLKDIRIHDLRHTLASWQAGTGASLLIIGATLNHKSASATSRYAHVDSSPVRKSMDLATAAMLLASQSSEKIATAA